MKKYTILSASVLLMILITSSAFSQNQAFSYKYPVKPVSYATKSNIHEILDIQGQSMDVYVTNDFGCKIKSAGGQGQLTVMLDSLSQVIDSPQGVMGGPVPDVKDKSFNMSITPSGKVADLSGAKEVVYTVPGNGPANISTSFVDFFPELPEGQVAPGYTWTTMDSVKTEGQNTQVNVMTATRKFEGFEEVNGVKCAKFTAETKGTSKMNTEAQGMNMKTTGNFTGTTVTWFAPEGYFVKFTENTKLTGTMEMTNEGYSFPITMEIKKSTEVVK